LSVLSPGDRSDRGIGRELSTRVSPERASPLLYRGDYPIAKAVATRLERLVRLETRRSDQPRIVDPDWSRLGRIPGLIVAQRVENGTAFRSARQIAGLDKAFRRAAALIDLVEGHEHIERWPLPIRPERGGLLLLDVEYGSLDALWTFYGTLTTLAQSSPVSLISLASLAWDASRSAAKATQWTVHRLAGNEILHRPSAADPGNHAGEPWKLETTKRMLPVLLKSVEEGYGIDFTVSDDAGKIRLLLTPRPVGGRNEDPGIEDGPTSGSEHEV
jgi:hypothetical protein